MSEIDVGARLKEARESANMRPVQFVKFLGENGVDLSFSHLSNIERGRRVPSLELWLKIQEALKAAPTAVSN